MFQRGFGRVGKVIVIVAGAGLLATACGGDDEGESDAAGAGVSYGAEGGGGSGELAEDESGGVRTMEFGGSAAPTVSQSIIKTADIRLEARHGDFTQAIQEIESAAPRYGGFVFSTSLDDASTKSGRIVLRVPAEDFESALRDVKDAGELLGENIAGKDVSQEFIDLEARINNLQAQEAVFLDLMDRATTITQTVRMQNQLSSLQLDIEQLQGRLNFLEDRTALGTISVSVIEEGAPVPGKPNTFELAFDKAVDVLEGLGAALIFLVIAVLIPMAFLGLIVLAIMRQIRLRSAG